MFDIGATELLIIVIVAVVVIGPKDMPLALRHAGRWIGKMRRLSGHFRAGVDAMVREAELEDMEKQWKAQNERVMREHPAATHVDEERAEALPDAESKSGTPATGSAESPAGDAANAPPRRPAADSPSGEAADKAAKG